MEKENIFMEMEAIIMEIGLKERCRESVSYMTQMVIFNIKDNGKMIIIMEKAPFMV
jgi:hypothetical protein